MSRLTSRVSQNLLFLFPDFCYLMSPISSWNTAVTSPIKNNSQKYTGRNDSISHLPLESWKELQTGQFCPCSCLLAVSFENTLVIENGGNCPETKFIYCTLKPQQKMHCRGCQREKHHQEGLCQTFCLVLLISKDGKEQ